MDKKGNATLGFALLLIGFLFIITAFATIDPLKESLDEVRGNSNLNCPGTPAFDQADYNNDTDFEKSVRRPTCFVTGLTMVWFVMAFVIAVFAWVVKNWRKVS